MSPAATDLWPLRKTARRHRLPDGTYTRASYRPENTGIIIRRSRVSGWEITTSLTQTDADRAWLTRHGFGAGMRPLATLRAAHRAFSAAAAIDPPPQRPKAVKLVRAGRGLYRTCAGRITVRARDDGIAGWIIEGFNQHYARETLYRTRIMIAEHLHRLGEDPRNW